MAWLEESDIHGPSFAVSDFRRVSPGARPTRLAATAYGTIEISCSGNPRNGSPSYTFSRTLEFKSGVSSFARSGRNYAGELRSDRWKIDARKLAALSVRAEGDNGRGHYSVVLKGRVDPQAKTAFLSGGTLNKRGVQVRRCSAKIGLGDQTFAALNAPGILTAGPAAPLENRNAQPSPVPSGNSHQTSDKAPVEDHQKFAAGPGDSNPASSPPRPLEGGSLGNTATGSSPIVSQPTRAPVARGGPGASPVTPNTAQEPQPNGPRSVPQSAPVTAQNAQTYQTQIGALIGQVNVLAVVLNEQREMEQTGASSAREAIRATIGAIESRVAVLKQDVSQRERRFREYLTSVRPNDRDLHLTARKASEIYPRIPYYIPGTSEIGEFWVEPVVSERGEMMFSFQFVDFDAYVTNVRGKIEMKLSELEDVQRALLKLYDWSTLAHEEKIRRNYEKRVTCFPAQDCPEDGERKDGFASTEIRFNVYEDGSTAGRIQRNKGRFAEGYNVSIESGLLLQAYLGHVIREARLEFRSGTQDKKSLDKLFQ